MKLKSYYFILLACLVGVAKCCNVRGCNLSVADCKKNIENVRLKALAIVRQLKACKPWFVEVSNQSGLDLVVFQPAGAVVIKKGHSLVGLLISGKSAGSNFRYKEITEADWKEQEIPSGTQKIVIYPPI